MRDSVLDTDAVAEWITGRRAVTEQSVLIDPFKREVAWRVHLERVRMERGCLAAYLAQLGDG
jgi:hypothetical protein